MKETITSLTNPKVKYVRRLQTEKKFRLQEQAFVVEGSRWLAELPLLGYDPLLVVSTDTWLATANDDILPYLADRVQVVSPAVLAAMSDVETPPGVLAVLPIRPLPLPVAPSWLLVLDGVMNPGNLGTILRSAAAAGVEGVLLGPGCVDVYNPKVVRGGMGAHVRLPLATLSWAEILTVTQKMARWLAVVDGGEVYTAVDWRRPSVLVIGGEANGVGGQALEAMSGRVTIPMHRQTESLNAAMAASIILFEAARQRSR